MTIRVTDDTPQAEQVAILEARCRRLIAKRAALPNGWGYRAERRALLEEISDALEEYNLARAGA